MVLLEARERIGGRIHTLHDPASPVPIELGAEFVHGRPPQIFDLPALQIDEMNGDRWRHEGGRLQMCNDFMEETENVLGQLSSAGDDDRSFLDFMQECCRRKPVSEDEKAWATEYVEGFNAAHQERISVQSLIQGDKASESIEGDRLFRVAGGYQRVVDTLRSSFDNSHIELHTNTVVTAIQWRRGGVDVETEGRKFSSRQALITIPVSLLQTDAIRFSPDLPGKRAAARQLEMGPVIRITLVFREQFWPRNLAMLFSHDPCMPTWWTRCPLDAPVITGWAAGRRAERLRNKTAAEIEDESLAALRRLFRLDRARLRELLVKSYVHDWQADPFSRGAYSYVLVGGINAPKKLAEPVEGTLFFAGEATETTGHGGTVHGAIMTGERAAKQILATL